LKDPPWVLDALGGRFAAIADQNDLPRMRAAYSDLRGAQDRHGASPIDVARTIADFGTRLTDLGSPEEGRRLLRSALAQAHAAGDKEGLPRMNAALARACALVGDFTGAARAANEAVEGWRAAGRPMEMIDALAVAASVYSSVGDRPSARSAFQEALDVPGAPAELRAALFAERGRTTYEDGGDLDAALKDLTASQNAQDSLGDAEASGLVRLHVARVQLLRGAVAEAAKTNREALEKLSATGGSLRFAEVQALEIRLRAGEALEDDVPARLSSWLDEAESRGAIDLPYECARTLAEILLARKRAPEAARAIERARGAVDRARLGLSDVMSVDVHAQYGEIDELGVRVALALGDPDGVFRAVQRAKGSSFEEAARIPTAGSGAVDPAVQGARERLAALERAYQLSIDSGPKTEMEAARRARDAARAEHLRTVAGSGASMRGRAVSVSGEPPTLASLQSTLGEGELVLEFFTAVSPALCVAFRRGDVRVARDPDTSDLATQCLSLDPNAQTQTAVEAWLARFKDRLVKWIGPVDAKRVFVCPDGPLALVPWPLVLGSIDSSLDREVALLPSAGLLPALRRDVAVSGSGVLALGDPDYSHAADGVAHRLYFGGRVVRRLEASGPEARAVASPDLPPLLGPAANESRLQEALRRPARYRSVHLACHGHVDLENPWFTSLVLAPDAGNDGLWTLHEVMSSRVDADQVVLSACDTARGKRVRAEGVLGLPRAFFAAGTPRVVASTWKVPEGATSDLMKRFYENLAKPGATTAGALRLAQAAVAASPERRHPRFWAAWAVWGLPE
jgi:tetratricopeptide (TPR) repeat protein